MLTLQVGLARVLALLISLSASAPLSAATLRGTIEAPDGEPVTATLRLLVDPEADSSSAVVFMTDERGAFERTVPGETAYRLRVEAPGLRPVTLDNPPAGRPLSLRLETGRTLRGRVVDGRSGQGVEDAEVWVCDEEAARFGFASCAAHRADAGGEFHVSGVPSASVWLGASSASHAFNRIRVPAEDSEHDYFRLDLEPGAPVSGLVVDSRGEPMAGVRIGRDERLRPFNDQTEPAFDPPLITDESGGFRHPGVKLHERGAYRGMRAGWYGTPEVFLNARDPEKPVELKMERPAALQFGLRHEDGESVRADVRLVHQSLGSISGPRASAGEDGRYHFADLPTKPLTLTLSVKGHVPLELGEVPFSAGGTIDLGELTVGRGITIRGTVLDTDGGIVEQGWVQMDYRNPARYGVRVALDAGAFVFEGVPPNAELTFRVTSDGYESLLETRSFEADARWEPILTQHAAVSGRVLLPGGRPATRFEARVFFQDKPSTSEFSESVDDPGGAFLLAAIRPAGTYTLEIHKQGYRTTTVEDIVVGEKRWVDVGEIELDLGHALTGVALRPDGTPATGAGVAVIPRAGGGQGRPVRPETTPTAVADVEGRFEVTGLSPGYLTVDATHPDFAPWRGEVHLLEEVEKESVLIEFSTGGLVHGHARDRRGGPIQGIQVGAECARLPAERTVRSDDAGYYRIVQLPVDQCRVWAFRDDGSPFGNPRLVTIAEGRESQADFDLSTAIEVTGIVRLGGEPVERGYVMFDSAGGFAGSGVASVPVDADGRYRAELSEPGEYRARVESGGARTVESIVVPEQKVVERDFDIPVNWILGRVVDENGDPVPQVEILGSNTQLDLSDTMRTFAYSRQDGRFELRNLRPGSYTITAMRAGYRRTTSEPIDVRQDTRIDGLELVLAEATLRITGKLVDPGGNGIPDGFVIAAPVGTRRLEFANHATTRADGTFELDSPTEGPVDITALSGEWAAARISGYVADGKSPLTLRAGHGGHVTVRVTDRDGEPREGVALEIRPEPDWLGSNALNVLRVPPVSGPDGIAHARFLTEGTYRIRVPGGASVMATVYDGQISEVVLRTE